METNWINIIVAFGGVLGSIVTAVATIFLWLVTKNLAKETRRMVEAGSRPHIVATIAPNRWSMNHADIHVENTGNATAYDIEISFDPPLPYEQMKDGSKRFPLQNVSILKPGQATYSYLSDFAPLMGNIYTANISWTRDPKQNHRERNEYTLDMHDLDEISRLGSSDPLAQMAQDIKKMREEWESVARGSRRIGVDIFTSGDRLHERRQRERWRRKQIQKDK
jgi:hypothetical protein